MSSKVQICNLALSRINASRITSLTDNTIEAKLCNVMFDDLADEVMAEGPWSSTLVRTSLAQTVNTPSFGFDNEFQLPTDPYSLRVYRINEDVPGSYEFRVEGDKLLISIDAVSILYGGRVTNTQNYGVLLTRTIVSKLASELVYPLTGNLSLSEKLYQRYQIDLQTGLAADGQQGSNDFISSSKPLDDDVR